MRIRIYCISKPEEDSYASIAHHFKRLSLQFGCTLEVIELFNKQVAMAQQGGSQASIAYANAFEPYLDGTCSVALSPQGKEVNSQQFAKILENSTEISFFIGGAYGFEEGFLRRCRQVISLTPLTLSHKIAKVVLCEQIYRGMSLLRAHPYHK